MALVAGDFIPLSAMANSSAPRMFSYRSDSDNAAAVETANYFDSFETASQTQTGDVLLCKASDATKLYNLTVDRTAGTVAVSTGTAIA